MIEQGTVEWLKQRQGMITCSRLADVLKRSRAYARQLHQERTAPEEPKIYEREPASLAWGHMNEPRAIAAYEMTYDVEVERIGFVVHPDLPFFGGSADGLLSDRVIEVKCPIVQGLHSLAMSSGWHRREEQESQVQGLMEILDRDRCDFVSYDPRLEPYPHAMVVSEKTRSHDLWSKKMRPAIVWFNEWVNSEGFADHEQEIVPALF